MALRIGTPLPRRLIVTIYVYVAFGFGLISALTAWKGMHGWYLPSAAFVVAVALLVLPNLVPRAREFVQVDEDGVSVLTKKGTERVTWQAIERVRIITTDAGPFGEDVYFLLEAPGGKGCAVPHDAAVRTKLLEELQSRLKGLHDDKVIEAMGCTSNSSFTIWERASASAV